MTLIILEPTVLDIPLRQALSVFFLSGTVGVLLLGAKLYLFPVPKPVVSSAPVAQVAPPVVEPFSLTTEANEAKEKVAELKAKAQKLRKEAEETDKEILVAEKIAKDKEFQAAKEIESMEQLIAASKSKLAYQPIPRKGSVEKEAVQPPAVETSGPQVQTPEVHQAQVPQFREFDPKELKKVQKK